MNEETISGDRPTVIIGAGPAGLTAAYELSRGGHPVRVLDRDPVYVGGISRTVEHKGFRFDIGGHRFFSKNAEIEELWTEILGPRLQFRERLSRIYYRGRFFAYPLEPLDALRKLGLLEAFLCVLSYARAQLFPPREIRSFEDWVVAAFGHRLYRTFFRTYTEKVWGIPCTEISADWAAQRINGLSIPVLIRDALRVGPRRNGAVIKTLIDRFRYPPRGPGEMWETVAARVRERGGELFLGEAVIAILRSGKRLASVVTRNGSGHHAHEGNFFISSMPIAELVEALDPPAPPDVQRAARALRYRDFVTVALILDQSEVFPDQWIYVHDPAVRVGRIQNFKNWSPEMVPDPRYTVLGLEYFCNEGDDLWDATDDRLVDLARRELAALTIVDPARVIDGVVVRQPKAYPVYDHDYRENVARVRKFLDDELPNLHLAGRNGMHKYNNQDHAMMTGLVAARNILGASLDPWRVNADAEYLEAVIESDEGGRAVPGRIEEPSESVWGVPALDVITPTRGYLGIRGLPLVADVATFYVLNSRAGIWFVFAFLASSLVGSIVHHYSPWSLLSSRPRPAGNPTAVAVDWINCFLVNIGILVIYVQYFHGGTTVSRLLTAVTLFGIVFARQNLLAARRRRMIQLAEKQGHVGPV